MLIIASMVEREAQLARDRPLIAAVIYNRLKQGIPLGIDATMRYATNNWTRPLRQSELTRDSPYNTRTRQGLPPTPIGNPGARVDPGRGASGEREVPLLRRQARAPAASTPSRPTTSSSCATPSATRRARAEGRALADEVLTWR